jgi:radical SAM superfamily enzyme YgiQ (UPF0313 family)
MHSARNRFVAHPSQHSAPTRRVILVALDWHRPKDPRLPLGHASLAARLATTPGVELIHGAFDVNDQAANPDWVAERILEQALARASEEVDVALGAYVWNESHIQRVLPRLRQGGFQGRIILGGPQISYAGPGLEVLYPQADVFVRGAGEDALASLCGEHGASAIPGVHVAGEPDREEHARVDLKLQPSPWLSGICATPPSGFVRWESQRGCPYRCAFCQHRDPGSRPNCQHADPARIAAEQSLLVEQGAREIAVLDPVFSSSPRSVAVLNRFAQLGFGGRLELQAHFDLIREPMLAACARLDCCLELGLQTIHAAEQRAIGRVNDIDRASEMLAELNARGIDCEVSLIYGLPEQTPESFRATVAWLLERRVPVIKAFPLVLLRGTGLDRERARWGLEEDDASIPRVVRNHSFDEAGWAQMHALAQALGATEGHHPTTLSALERSATNRRAA